MKKRLENEELIIAKNKYELSINRQIEKSGGFGGIASSDSKPFKILTIDSEDR